MREGDDDTVPCPDEARQLVLRLRQPACSDCGSLRLEREGLAARERIELAHAYEVERRKAFLLQHARHVVRLPDQIRGPVDGRHESFVDC